MLLAARWQVLNEEQGWPPREQNLWWEKVPYLLDDFGLHLLGEPMGTPFAPPKTECDRAFNLSVLTDTQLLADQEAGTRFLADRLGGGPWVLDVDLDFFATLAPALAPAVRRGSDAWVSAPQWQTSSAAGRRRWLLSSRLWRRRTQARRPSGCRC